MLTVLALAGVLVLLLRPTPVARRVTAPATTEQESDQDKPSKDAGATSANAGSAARPEDPAPSGAARLLFDFEHSLKSGTLRVWVDDHPVIGEPFGGRVTRRLGGLEMRKGRVTDTLEVAPGRREVRVQVSWEDNVRTESAWANFKAGATLRLKARLGSMGGIRKDLSLDWD
jgi:hypothetical protein